MAVLKYKKQDGTYATLTNISIKGVEPSQTTGTSTTDVMSQNAITNELSLKATNSDLNTVSGAVSTLNTTVTAHTAATDIHVSASDKTNWNGKLDQTTFETYSGSVSNQITTHTGNADIHVTTDNKANWNDAYSKRHEHSNKDVLDGITSTKVDAWDGKLSKTDFNAYSGNVATSIGNNASSIESVNGTLTAHTSNNNIHVTTDDKNKWNDVVNKLATADFESWSATTNSAIAANTSAISKLNGDASTSGSVKNTVAGEIAKVVASAPEDFDTLKEIADWIANDKDGAAKMRSDITTNAGNITAVNNLLEEHSGNTTMHITSTERTTWNAANNSLTAHTADTTVHINDTERTRWNTVSGKVDTTAYTAYQGEVTTALNGKADNATFTAHAANTTVHITAAERTKWDAVTSKANAATTLGGYGITDAKIENGNVITLGNNTITALTQHQDISGKVDNATFTAHTASTVHMTATEKTNLDSLAANIAAISGITADDITKWNNEVDIIEVQNNTNNVTVPDNLHDGQNKTVIYNNTGTSDITVAISTSSTVKTPDGKALTLTVKGGGYGEVNYLQKGTIIFVRGV